MLACESDILQRLANGDEIAFKRVFDLYWEKVFCICLYYLRNEDDAKDIAQAIFMDLWLNRQRLTEIVRLDHYLSGAARYQCFNQIRNRNIRQQKLANWPEGTSPLTTVAADPAEHVEYKELVHCVAHLIDKLPEPRRTIFLMSRSQELSYQKIAVIKGISIKTVQYHISTALHFLRTKLH